MLNAIEDSTNSKGSAERRNVEIMKTYQKQLEQTKAAATELQMELGRFIFPVFKFGLRSLKTLFEFMSNIPAPVKAAGVALTLFFGYASKGVHVIDKLVELVGRGKGVISSFARSISKEFDISKFEIFGGGRLANVEGLKTLAKGVPDALKAAGLKDLHSGFGKLAYILRELGEKYNMFAADMVAGAGKAEGGIVSVGEAVENLAKKIDNITDLGQFLTIFTPGQQDDVAALIIEGLEKGTQKTGEFIQWVGRQYGEKAKQFAEYLSEEDPGLIKALAPLAVTITAAIPLFSKLADKINRSRVSAQEYAQSVYNARRVQEDQINNLTTLSRQYDRLKNRIEEVNKVEADADLKSGRKASDRYQHPLLALSDIQRDATKWANELAKTNNDLILGYDKQGNAILKLSGNYKEYLANLQRASALELAKTDVDVLAKFTEDLTGKGLGESIKNVLDTALSNIPAFGPLLQDIVRVSPAKQMEIVVDRLNDLLRAREENPLTSAFDKDIEALQDALDKIKNIYDGTIEDFRKSLAGIFKFPGATAIDRDTIANLLSDPKLAEGFELIVKIDPVIDRINYQRAVERASKYGEQFSKRTDTKGIPFPLNVPRIEEIRAFSEFPAVTGADVLGSEVLKKAFPDKAAVIGVAKEQTKALLEGLNIGARDLKQGAKVLSGDIVTFFTSPADSAGIAGAQAIVELKKNVDGVLEAFVTYFNTKTKEFETRPLEDDQVFNMVESIFPTNRIMEELDHRIDALHTFVTGAAAGISGINPKDFKVRFLQPQYCKQTKDSIFRQDSLALYLSCNKN